MKLQITLHKKKEEKTLRENETIDDNWYTDEIQCLQKLPLNKSKSSYSHTIQIIRERERDRKREIKRIIKFRSLHDKPNSNDKILYCCTIFVTSF